MQARYNAPRFPLKPISELALRLQYGTSSLATEEPIGLPILRMNNLQADGWDLSDLKYIELPPTEMEAYRLVPGDILFNRTNGSRDLVGKCEVFHETGHWIFASYLIRMSIDTSKALPEFISAFLNTSAGRLQIERVSRQILMSNINLEEIKSLLIPIPPIDTQRELVGTLEAGRLSRRQQLADAAELLSGVDGFLLEKLGLHKPPVPTGSRIYFAVKLKEISHYGRLNANYYHPEREAAIRAMQDGGNMGRLGDIALFVRDITNVTDPTEYTGLANVQRNTGELIDVAGEEAEGTAFRFQEGDVLFARLRPYLNKVFRAEKGGVCSTEFHVIRVNATSAVLPDYLATVLRSSLVVAQTKHMMTGNTHPRLANEDVANLVVPIPSQKIQKAVVAEVVRRRTNARQLQDDAAAQWATTKKWFEDQLLG